MMTLPKILFLTFVVGGLSAPRFYFDIDATAKSGRFDESTARDNIAENDQKISVTRLSDSDVVILDPYKRGINAIEKVAETSYQKLLSKTPVVNYQKTHEVISKVNYPTYYQNPVDNTQVLVGGAITLPHAHFQLASSQNDPWRRINNFVNHLNLSKQTYGIRKSTVVPDNKFQVKYSAQIDPVPVFSAEFVPTNRPLETMKKNQYPITMNPIVESIIKSIKSMNTGAQLSDSEISMALQNFITSNEGKNVGMFSNVQLAQLWADWKPFITPSMIQNFLATFINQDNAKSTAINSENESSTSIEDQSISMTTRPTFEALLGTTNQPSEYSSTNIFEMTTEDTTSGLNNEEIMSSTTQEKLPEIDGATAIYDQSEFVPSTFEDTEKYSNINKDDLYVMYKQPITSTQDGFSSENVEDTVALNGSKIKDVRITKIEQMEKKDCDDKSNLI